ncbi:hypothetical protein JA1_001191 [Spathaspora sp. JA1]|nr:hypothetical protein JA1_001191 [Spathaspora sp. JA1]
MDMNIDTVSMNTPTKRINQLSLASPPEYLMNSPSSSSIATCMVNKGYSHRLTDNVLSELDSRANEISMMINSPPSSNSSSEIISTTTSSSKPRSNKRFSIIHMTRFNQMESIAQHYSVHETSSSKRRRTLNGKDEVIAIPIPNTNENEDQRKEEIRKISPTKTTFPNKISPSKISPSKGSMNLHAQLHEKTSQVTDTGSPNKGNIITPPGSRSRVSSLELSGVKNLQRKSSIPQLQQYQETSHTLSKKPSIPQLQKKPSIPQLQKKPSIPQLQKKPSIPQLQKKSSIPQLQRKSSIPQLQKKPSIPNLDRKPSIPQLYHSTTVSAQATVTTTTVTSISTSLMPPPPPPSHTNSHTHSHPHPNHTIQRKSSIPQLQKIPNLTRVSPSKSLNQTTPTVLLNSTNIPKSKSVTVPQPFSLYDKPTISSSQKSLNKFQRFKDKFN